MLPSTGSVWAIGRRCRTRWAVTPPCRPRKWATPWLRSSALDFHVQFERIHPFQDGNGRVGRLLLLKECLRHGIVPFVLGDDLRAFYYRGLSEWQRERGFLRDTCLTAQDRFKLLLDGFRIPYEG